MMNSSAASAVPEAIIEKFSTIFQFPEKMVFGQFATQSPSGPHIRTMRLYRMTPAGYLAFLSHTDTGKWRDMERDSNVTICFYQAVTQIIVSGIAERHTCEEDRELLQSYWESLPLSSRQIYSAEEPEKLPETLGLIYVIPKMWEMLEINAHYPSSSRSLFLKQDEGWECREIGVSS